MEDLAHHPSIRKMTYVEKPSAIPDHRGSLLSPGRSPVHSGQEPCAQWDWCQAHQHIGSAPHLNPASHTFTPLVLGPPSKRKPLMVWTHDMAQLWMANM